MRGTKLKSKKVAPLEDQDNNKFAANDKDNAELLTLFNAIWISGNIPKQFKHAVVIPIYKQGKDKKDPASYRLISLTSHLGKVLETIMNKRLTYHLEANNLISDTQAGFRKDRQTLDQIVALENSVKAAKTNSRTVGAIFLDLEKAYDTMWREGLLMKLKKLGI
ncbi:reverse transcriptase [Plakobranchus ocellatus]|uniref:Reverse transcriptase n=1 Tax=Plakobranchus ocellatus TaxID=259542 RepID=A0AAV3ZN62_9GAST|nr:reverse transcriptase [Plakobranchus ocellatus]